MRPIAVAVLIVAIGACANSVRPASPAIQTTAADRPSLIVLLVVDQMRTDYLERGLPQFTSGLKRLTGEGAWFRNAAYPYLNTITCAGHSTIGTGAFPYRHGMVLNTWWDRTTAKSRACTADSTVKNIGYSGTASGGDSAASLRVPTLADYVGQRAQGRVVAMSLKPRSAITLSGSHPASVVWLDDRAGWATSSAFTAAKLPWLSAFIESRPASQDVGAVWTSARRKDGPPPSRMYWQRAPDPSSTCSGSVLRLQTITSDAWRPLLSMRWRLERVRARTCWRSASRPSTSSVISSDPPAMRSRTWFFVWTAL
jgi:hypothetical protein